MNPEDFCEKWNATRSDLAALLSISQSTIDKWFSPKAPDQPTEQTLRRLDEYDGILEQWQTIRQTQETRFPILYQIFLKANDELD